MKCNSFLAVVVEPVRELSGELGLMRLNGKSMAIDDLWRNGTASKAYWLWEQSKK